MRIIVLQLARFGDLYQTWPTLNALRRLVPNVEIHVLTRERFRSGLHGLEGLHVHALPSAEILRPIFEDRGEGEALRNLDAFLAPLRTLRFDRVINLSFSPLSSYLTDILAENSSEVSGYTRFGDGTLAIAGDMSAYFYAQVGVDRPNRFHITDIFAAVAGVDLAPQDFNFRDSRARRGVVVHLGASTSDKTYAPELWVEALQGLREREVTLIGSANEENLSRAVEARAGFVIRNLVGATKLEELFDLIGDAELVIGADSAPMHIASLVGTPALNLSSKTVNFFETGPRSAGSRVLFAQEIHQIPPRHVAEEATAILNGEPIRHALASRAGVLHEYELHREREDFSWRLIQALYTNADYPAPETANELLALQRLHDLADLARVQFARWDDSEKRIEAANVLAQVDNLLIEVARHEPRVGPLVEWFQTRRLCIPPANDAETLARTKAVFAELELITSLYLERQSESTLLATALRNARRLLPEMRECDLGHVAYEFQNLVDAMNGLALAPTKVGERNFWAEFLPDFGSALEARDYVRLADLTESQLLPELSRRMNADSRHPDVLS